MKAFRLLLLPFEIVFVWTIKGLFGLWPLPAEQAYRDALKDIGLNERATIRKCRRLFRRVPLDERKVLVVADDGVVSFYAASKGADVTCWGGGTDRFLHFTASLSYGVELARDVPGRQFDVVAAPEYALEQMSHLTVPGGRLLPLKR